MRERRSGLIECRRRDAVVYHTRVIGDFPRARKRTRAAPQPLPNLPNLRTDPLFNRV